MIVATEEVGSEKSDIVSQSSLLFSEWVTHGGS